MKTAVIIARFQTPYLHEGHKELIAQVKQKHAKLIILLGVSPIKGSRKNPYDYYTREKMIKKDYPEVVVLPISDNPSDKIWSENLDNLLKSVFSAEQFCLYGSRDSFIPYYSGKFETVELPEHGDYNATELRKQYADKVFDSKDFRAGILYAYYNQYAKVYPTVDVALFRNNRSEILLGKKAINNKWRFVGGFSDPEDACYEDAAKRELTEECGEMETTTMQYETSAKINDWRYRSEADKIITLLFSCDFIDGEPQAQDDIADLAWFKLTDLPFMIKDGSVSEEHVDLFNFITGKYLKN
ncbi:bifunctional NMN adenylyltransferase/nudix hydrolase [Mucilaginibacter oryzae]|uniref:Bifunctional NMN adenylyltransferase/nudix hydrolase n=1 Tax=Mucilaginibacter oryzae TaxID=468058 RepID=A0A316HJ29_9SPHI|nr:NUDIX domain-containing protein [Mucilaginibacter oryzae]PWK78225.1 bifunctional NMN adenylyltransferase/nudix hydrolase [Mucilaginibacter oryzae]